MTLDAFRNGLTIVEFVARHMEAYIKDGEGTVDIIHKYIVEFVSGVVEHDTRWVCICK